MIELEDMKIFLLPVQKTFHENKNFILYTYFFSPSLSKFEVLSVVFKLVIFFTHDV